MNSFILFALVAVVITAVAGDCDVMKCIGDLQNVDYQNPKEACPVGREAIKCMENVINTCEALGNNKDSVQQPLEMAKENFRKACGDSAAAGDCDVRKCIGDLQNVDNQNPEEACPVGREAIKCMENVINTCEALGNNKDSVQQAFIELAKENFRKECGDSAAGFIQAQSMITLLPLAIIAAIYSRL